MSESGGSDGEEGKRGVNKRRLAFVAVLILLAGIALGVGVGLNLAKDSEQEEQEPETARFLVDCHPDKDAEQSACEKRGCIWSKRKKPPCSLPEQVGYKMAADPEVTGSGYNVTLTRVVTPSLHGMQPFSTLTVLVEQQADYRLRIKIFPPDHQQFEIPEEALSIAPPAQAANESTLLYDVTFTSEPCFGVAVTRRSSNATIFNSSLPGLAFYPQFLQISTLLHNKYVYGFGEHRHQSFRHDLNHKTWSIFTRDEGPNSDWNLYGAHPVYMNVEDDGRANMVFLKNSNAMEVTLQPDPSLTFRAIGGVLDFYIFLGDSPDQAVSFYTEAIGRPVLPPYWALGFQLSRWGYTNLTDMQMVIDRNRAAQIPYDVQWADIDSLYKKYLFTYDRQLWDGLPDLVNDLHDHHQHFVIIVDPGVGANDTLIAEAAVNSPGYNMFLDGQAADIFVKNSNDTTLFGEVWPGVTAYPDFTNNAVLDWLEKYVRFYRDTEGVKVDALWIDMNEPSSFVPGSVEGCNRTVWDYPPYVPHILGSEKDGKMFDKTICMTSKHQWGRHYDVHSLYAHSMAMQTNRVLQRVFPNKRPWAMTRSSFAGTGHYVTKWTGDNQSRWPAMHWSIISIMEFGLFGFAFNGADICGFWYETEYNLCVRWHQLGAFYPFARNHNAQGDLPDVFKHQDPASFDQRFVDLVKQPLMTRYRLLPYLYSLLFTAHLTGHPVLRPLLFQFPLDLKARDVDRQFMLGPALLVSPVLDVNATSVEAYFPESRWFEYFTGEEVTTVGQSITLDTPLDKFNLHVKGGQVIPWQTPSLTTYESRSNPMGLIVALDDRSLAAGVLYLDDGESTVNDTSYSHVSFTMNKAGELLLTPTKTGYSTDLVFQTLELYGLFSIPSNVRVDGVLKNSDVRGNNKIIQIINLNLTVLEPHNVTWAVY